MRSLHKAGKYVFSAGKGGLFKWDIRGDTWFPLEEKEKSLDIFTLVTVVLFLGVS